MEDISGKNTTLQEAKAEAIVSISESQTISALLENKVPKGNVFETAKVAGLFGVKNTYLNLPNSHPVPIEFTSVEFEIRGFEIHIAVRVKAICKSNLEMEAMHGASMVALTVYDMLKPIDKEISIQEIKISEKPESHSRTSDEKFFNAAVVVCSNSIAKGKKADSAGQVIVEKLQSQNAMITSYEIIPDDLEQIQAMAFNLSKRNQLVIFSGGTGLAKTDVTTEALEPLLKRRIPGIGEAMRSYGQSRTPYAMFSRSLAGTLGDCLILALPGSTRGATESMEAIFPHLLYALKGS